MQKVFLAILLLVLSIEINISHPLIAAANTTSIDEVQEKRQSIQHVQNKKQVQIGQVVTEIEQLQKDMNRTQLELEQHQEKIKKTEAKINDYEVQFYDLIAEVDKLMEKIDKRHEILKNRLIAYQESGGEISFLEVLLQSKSFIEFISRVSSVITITNADQQLIAQQTKELNLVEELENEISEKLHEQEKLFSELKKEEEAFRKQAELLKKSEDTLLEKVATLQHELNRLRQQDRTLQRLEASLREKAFMAANINPAQYVSNDIPASTFSKSNDKNSPIIRAGDVLRMEATGYGPDCKGCTGYTKTGMYVAGKYTPRVVAVDPNVIPLGTRVWVEGYGAAIAADIGSAIKGYKIDLLFPSEAYAAKYWGRRSVLVKILE